MALSEGALYACYRRMEKPLYNVLYRSLWQSQDCQDVINEAFLRVWDRRQRVDESSVAALIWTTALNLARNRLRWRHLWHTAEESTDPHGGDDPYESALRQQREQRLRTALAQLPRAMREVLLLGEFGGLSIAEVAAVLKIPAGTVGSRKHVALARLRAALAETDDD